MMEDMGVTCFVSVYKMDFVGDGDMATCRRKMRLTNWQRGKLTCNAHYEAVILTSFVVVCFTNLITSTAE